MFNKVSFALQQNRAAHLQQQSAPVTIMCQLLCHLLLQPLVEHALRLPTNHYNVGIKASCSLAHDITQFRRRCGWLISLNDNIKLIINLQQSWLLYVILRCLQHATAK